MDEMMGWLTFYNHRRIHSTWGYVRPMLIDQGLLAAQLGKAA
jgi:transposase InsO family protein